VNEKLKELLKEYMSTEVTEEEKDFVMSMNYKSKYDSVLACGFYSGYMTAVDIPKHETVEQWESRTGESYPDYAPIWFYCRKDPIGFDWLPECYGVTRIYPTILKSVVRNHHGKPPIEKDGE
jgi:hypothetical protein